MPILAVAIEHRQWELAAYCLLVGLAEAAAKLPPDALNGLLAVLEEAPTHERHRR
ncbi:MAG: hypothetical protein ACE5IZ_06370 [Dehalococcoidia bacterium]